MSSRLNPADIPPDGSRHTFVVTKAGTMTKPPDGEIVDAIHAMIDTGDFKGKRVSSEVPWPLRIGHRFEATLRVFRTAFVGGGWKPVDEDYNASNPRIRYALEDFARTRTAPEIEVRRPREKFRRTA